MAADGHYYVDGSLEGVPVRFLVDTGAAKVSVSQRVADRLGAKRCVDRVNMGTANGVVQNACVLLVQKMTIAGHKLTNVDVVVGPDMVPEALLGMDVMRFFRLTQQSKKLIIEF